MDDALSSSQTRTPRARAAPLSADDKFLALAGYLLAVPIVYRVTSCGGITMIAILVALAYYHGGEPN